MMIIRSACLFIGLMVGSHANAQNFLVFGGCNPGGQNYCEVMEMGTSSGIGCVCSGGCTNPKYVQAQASVWWTCTMEQVATAWGDAYEGSYFVTAGADIIGTGSPSYESVEQTDYCDRDRETTAGIMGTC